MKNAAPRRLALPCLLIAVCLALCACGGTAQNGTPSPSPAGEDAGDTAEDPYAYLADFSYSALFDENGYIAGVTASDYVTLPEDYDVLTLPAGSDTVDAETLEDYIESEILDPYKEYPQVTDRAAEMGDTVNIDFVGSVDGVEFDGGNTQGQGYELELTGSNFIDDFEEQIAGHMPGDTFNVEVTFPDPYKNNPDLAGKDAVFVTTLHYIVGEPVLPELDDTFVQENLQADLGFATAGEVRDYVEQQLRFNQMSDAAQTLLEEDASYAETLPETVTDYFRDYVLYGLYSAGAQYGMTADAVAMLYGYDSAAAYVESGADAIEEYARYALLMQAIAEDKGLTCPADELEERFTAYYLGYDVPSLTEYYGAGYLQNDIVNHMAMEALIEGATTAAQ